MSEQQSEYRDEIDLVRLLSMLFATRTWVAIGLATFSVSFWAFQAAKGLSVPVVHTYATRIDLVFDGVEESRYPNGSPFDIADIIAPVILNRVYDSNGLHPHIDRGDFVAAFSIAPYTPDRNMIVEKYSNEARGLKQAEIEDLQERLKRELVGAARGQARINFTSDKARKIPEGLIAKVLLDVPSEWARHRIEDIGVLRHDRVMYSDKVVDSNLLESVDYLIGFEMLLDLITLLRGNLDKISELPNGSITSDNESGLTVPDLRKAIGDVERYRVVPLMNPVRALGIAKDQEVVILYFENLLNELGRDREVNVARRQNVRDAQSSYSKLQAVQETAERSTVGSGSMIPQFGAEFLDRIVEMTNAGEDIEYRQELNSLQLSISDAIAEQDGEISRIREILETLQDDSASHQHELRQRYVDNVTSSLPQIIEQLRTYFIISNSIYDELSQTQLGRTAELYRHSDGDVHYSSSNQIFDWSNVQLFLILGFLMTVVLIPAAMLYQASKDARPKHDKSVSPQSTQSM